MSKHLEFIFDFGSPNAYMAYKALPPILDRTGATLTILPCLLGGIFKATNNQAPWMTFANVPSKMEYERLEMMRFIRLHALTRFKLNPNFPVNPEIKAKLIENTENAIARGCFGVPTFYVGEEMFFGKDRLAQIERSLAS